MTRTENISFKLYHRLSTLAYFTGLPYVWHEPPSWSPYIQCIHDKCSIFLLLIHIMLWLSQILSFYTQKHLNSQQKSDQMLFVLLHPFVYTCSIAMMYYKQDVKRLIQNLAEKSLDKYNDETIEMQMVKKCNCAVVLIMGMGAASFTLIGIESSTKALLRDGVFSTLITAWPVVEDRSLAAGIGRICIYIVWFTVFLSICGGISVTISLIIAICHQYKHLQSYFYNLSSIFDEVSTQTEREIKFEEGLKIGIKQHVKLLGYTRDLVKIGNPIYGVQIIINTILVIMNLLVLVGDDRSLPKMLSCVVMMLSTMLSMGLSLCSMGDISVEAAKMTSAMYSCGWENCGRGSSVRVRKLLGVAMAQTQNHLMIKTLGIIPLSYASFVSIVKSTYSVFSVLY